MIRRGVLGVVLCILAAYLALAVPLPAVLLEDELGLFTGDPAHTVHDDHAWLDHAAGYGLSESAHILDVGNLLVSLALQAPSNPSLVFSRESCPSRGPPLV